MDSKSSEPLDDWIRRIGSVWQQDFDVQQRELKTEYQFPLDSETRAILQAGNDPFREFASMSADVVRIATLKRFAFPGHPHLAEFAEKLLQGAGPPFLTLLHDPRWQVKSYLSFRNGASEFHLAGTQRGDEEFRALYPFEKVVGLLEFFENFGGMVPSILPPSPVFFTCGEKTILDPSDPKMKFGNIGNWAKSLAWFSGGSGDMIIFHPDGTPGVWCHDQTDEEQTWPINLSFPQLLRELLKFIFNEGTREEQEDNVFYY